MEKKKEKNKTEAGENPKQTTPTRSPIKNWSRSWSQIFNSLEMA